MRSIKKKTWEKSRNNSRFIIKYSKRCCTEVGRPGCRWCQLDVLKVMKKELCFKSLFANWSLNIMQSVLHQHLIFHFFNLKSGHQHWTVVIKIFKVTLAATHDNLYPNNKERCSILKKEIKAVVQHDFNLLYPFYFIKETKAECAD